MKVRPLFAWYDAWVGVFWDKTKRRLYILPLPFVGVVVEFAPPSAPASCPHGFRDWDNCPDCCH